MSPEENTVLQLIWSHFKQHGGWPPKLTLWSQLRHLNLSLDQLASRAPWLLVSSIGDAVSVSLETLLEIPEVRTLLAPLPRFLQLLARRFVEEPDLNTEHGSRGPEVQAEAFLQFWKNESEARLAAKLLWTFCHELGGRGDPDAEFYFRPQLDILRYEKVESLEQYLAASVLHRESTVRQAPQGQHLALLQTVYVHIQKTGQWPGLAECTLQHREQLGYLPHLVMALTPHFIHPQNRHERPARIHLGARAVPVVAGETGCALALSIVRTLVELLVEQGAQKKFSIEQIAGKMKLPVEQVLPVAMLLEQDGWGRIDGWAREREGWQVELHTHVIDRLKDVRTWEEYIRVCDRYSPNVWFPPMEPPSHPKGFPTSESIVDQAIALAKMHVAPEPPPSPPRPAPATGRLKVFIGHGNSEAWWALKEFLSKRLGLEPVEFNSTPATGHTTVERLQKCLEECQLAVLVMTGEDEHPDGNLLARQNVVHEIGLFQAKLGFDKVLILVEDKCTVFSNIHGLTHHSFRRGKIGDCFEDIRAAVEHLFPRAG
ncbi:nucleotide-binding protein [Corallococcus exercitus]|uniref:Nucleotide-binding protein n=1 Tax=Corallococcus exercitus TaxID=2316736 RepID=A0A7Y4KLL9_9BACT|nr:nucleotide-binding protein [Corallococcus exercitus]NOK36055.1 nucleotide-binding protein [Corallococcus exercitus]